MKNILFILLSGLLLLSGCTGVKTVTQGLENEAFIEILGTPQNYPNGVEVKVDDHLNFIAEVNKPHADRPKGKVYAIESGRHTLEVIHNKEVIYRKEIFVGAQETKQITLP
ncbi:MAG: hypothetical protein LC643_01525 [Bacteroidales bacterium]|nr:hypothetical protein [Bacteroidales bacterium]